MNDRDLRGAIREVLARRLRQPPPDAAEIAPAGTPTAAGSEGWRGHASHDVYVTVLNTGDSCVIEPGVACNHCNYCKSHGH